MADVVAEIRERQKTKYGWVGSAQKDIDTLCSLVESVWARKGVKCRRCSGVGLVNGMAQECERCGGTGLEVFYEIRQALGEPLAAHKEE